MRCSVIPDIAYFSCSCSRSRRAAKNRASNGQNQSGSLVSTGSQIGKKQS